MNNYNQYKTAEWQKRKSERMALADFTCESCGNTNQKQLHVHHINYDSNRDLWEYEDVEFMCLCNECHSTIHDLIKTARGAISRAMTFVSDHPEPSSVRKASEDNLRELFMAIQDGVRKKCGVLAHAAFIAGSISHAFDCGEAVKK
jgi:hypothetical protein